MSLARSGENNPLYGKSHIAEAKAKISIKKGTSIYVYCGEGLTLINSFTSAKKAGEYFNVSYNTIFTYAKSGKLLLRKNEWILSTSNKLIIIVGANILFSIIISLQKLYLKIFC